MSARTAGKNSTNSSNASTRRSAVPSAEKQRSASGAGRCIPQRESPPRTARETVRVAGDVDRFFSNEIFPSEIFTFEETYMFALNNLVVSVVSNNNVRPVGRVLSRAAQGNPARTMGFYISSKSSLRDLSRRGNLLFCPDSVTLTVAFTTISAKGRAN